MRHSKNTFSQKVLRNEDSGEKTQSQGGNICNHTEGLLFECKSTYKERKCYGNSRTMALFKREWSPFIENRVSGP